MYGEYICSVKTHCEVCVPTDITEKASEMKTDLGKSDNLTNIDKMTE